MKIFVYGSLQKEGDNHDKMKKIKGEFLFPAETVKEYTKVHNFFYDSLTSKDIKGAKKDIIQGEVYEISDDNISFLDGFEDPLVRKEIEVEFENIKILVQCYFED